ncbi:hypothetical protein, partial [Bacillus sp. NPDC094106]|uniref:hypothetical protein n=1 Tax=Bacillus sp. NPDC094106 TaxID=3363949 RepID=UPI0037FD5C90
KRRLEPYDGKLSRTVLRGVRGSDAPRLPDLTEHVYHIQQKSHDVLLLPNGIIRKNGRGSSMNFIQVFDAIFSILYDFFLKGIWIVLFFFFLNKLYESQRLAATSRVITAVLLGIYFLYIIILRPLYYSF